MTRPRLLAAVVASAAFALGSPALAAPTTPPAAPDPAKVAWLEAHEVAAGPVAGPLALRLPPDLLHAGLVLLGESHGSAAPQVVDLALLAELNRRTGLRDYVAEVDPVQALTLNRYLETGDEALLTRVFALWKDREQWGNTAFMEKVRGVRALNLSLPPARRVRFIGLDGVQDWPLLLDWLEANGAHPDRLAVEKTESDVDRALLARAWVEAATGAPEPLRRRLAEGLAVRSAKGGREATIFANYAFAVRSGELGARSAYGLWGLFHVMQAGINGAQPFAMRVKASDLPAAASIRSIVLLSLDSAVLIPGKAPVRMTNLNVDGPVVTAPGAASLRAASRPDRTVVWRLDDARSPYRDAPDLVAVETRLGQSFKPTDPALPTTAYAQYTGVFRGSDWAAPIR